MERKEDAVPCFLKTNVLQFNQFTFKMTTETYIGN